jgi:hypothetical protein
MLMKIYRTLGKLMENFLRRFGNCSFIDQIPMVITFFAMCLVRKRHPLSLAKIFVYKAALESMT